MLTYTFFQGFSVEIFLFTLDISSPPTILNSALCVEREPHVQSKKQKNIGPKGLTKYALKIIKYMVSEFLKIEVWFWFLKALWLCREKPKQGSNFYCFLMRFVTILPRKKTLTWDLDLSLTKGLKMGLKCLGLVWFGFARPVCDPGSWLNQKTLFKWSTIAKLKVWFWELGRKFETQFMRHLEFSFQFRRAYNEPQS